jgi:hypothetical protein
MPQESQVISIRSPDNFRRYLLAGDVLANTCDLARLAYDVIAHIRRHVAENPSTSVDILRKMATDGNPDVRMALSENPNTPESTLFELCGDENPDVRHFMAANCNLSDDILLKLCDDENAYVATRALKSLAAKLSPSQR